MADRTAEKRAAAARALTEVTPGMVLGLGSGTTAEIFVELLADQVAKGLDVKGIPTSERTRMLAVRHGITLTSFDRHPQIDLAIDGADQVERGTLALVKGLGGALMREKIVAASAKRMIVIVDAGKIVPRLGAQTPVPVEIASFGAAATVARLEAAGYRPTLRYGQGTPFVTDGGNLIADCAIAAIPDAARLASELRGIVGVIETGLFVGMASTVIAGGPHGVEVLER